MAKTQTNNFQSALEATEKDLATLREIDIEKFNKEEKSNEVTGYVRKSLVLKAFMQSKDLTNGTWYVTGKSLSIMMNAISMFANRGTEYKHLLDSLTIELQPAYACYKVSYTLNDEAISNSYIHFLNMTYNLQIPEKTSDDRIKDIDNRILEANYNPVDLEAAMV